ncbi:hypothetical protein KY335_02310 [Candidatus Woesearchaeota archaeon]|nr:hypothetical protein [Candidatus Woesearchaeota archaeon]
MRPEEWEQLKNYNVDEKEIEKNSRIELQIAGAHAFRNNVEIEVARHFLGCQGQLFWSPMLDVEDVTLWHEDYNAGEAGRKQLQDLMDMGARAVAEFEKTRFFKIAFPKARPNASTTGGWFGSPWDRELNFHVFSRKFDETHERFSLGRVGRGDYRPYSNTDRSHCLWFSFSYKVPQLRLTTVEECVKTYALEPSMQAFFGELMIRTMGNYARSVTLVSDRLSDGREIITYCENIDAFFDCEKVHRTAPKRHESIIAQVVADPDKFALTDEDKEVHKYLDTEVGCSGGVK